MKTLARLLLCATTAVLAVAGAAFVWNHFTGGAVADDLAYYTSESQRADELLQVEEALARRGQLKREATAELVAGRLALPEAVAAFRRAHEGDPAARTDEWLAWNVAFWARDAVRERQPSAMPAPVRAELEGLLQAWEREQRAS